MSKEMRDERVPARQACPYSTQAGSDLTNQASIRLRFNLDLTLSVGKFAKYIDSA